MPETLTWNDEKKTQEYTLSAKIRDKKTLKFVFDKAYDKISVTLDGGKEYFPSSYHPETKSSFYNLNPLYRNIHTGKNTYTIKVYTRGKKQNTYTLTVHYLTKTKNIIEKTKEIYTQKNEEAST